MDGNSRLIIAFFILFIRSGLSQRHGSFGYQPPSSGSTGFGGGQSLGSQIGGNREGGDRRVSDAGSWNSFGSSKVDDNSRRVSSSGNGNNQWSGGSGWNSGFQTGGYGDGKAASNAGGLGFGSSQSGSQGSSGWNFGNQNEEKNPVDQNKDDNQRKTNSGSRRPGSSSGSSTSDFSFNFQSEGSKKDSDYGGSSIGFDSNRPQSSSSNGGNSNWGSSSGSRRPQGSSTSGNSNWSSGNQNGGTGGLGFSSSKQEENQGKPNSGWHSGTGNSSRRPQGTSSSNGNSNVGSSSSSKKPQASSGSSGGLSWGSESDSKRPQGGSSGGSSNWGSSSNSNSKRPQGGSSSSGNSDWGFNTDSDSRRPQDSDTTGGGLNFGSNSNSDSKRPQGSSSNSNSNWGSSSSPGSKKPQGSSSGDTLNFGSNSNSNSKRPEGSNSGGNSNWSSGSNSNKPQSSSGNSGSGYSSSKKPEDNRQKSNSNSGQRPSSNNGEPPNKQSGRPTNSQPPDKAGGNGKGSESRKPNDNGNANSNKTKTVDADWSNLETQNQQSSLVFDLSELWHPNDKKDPAWRSIWTRNRFRRDDAVDKTGKSPMVCHCTDYTACSPENRMNVLKFLENDHQDLRVRMVECATKKKICCLTTKREESGDKHPACGRRISKLAELDISNDGLANFGDYPWMLKLVADGNAGEDTLCGASLIHNSIALTTASCALLLTGKTVRVRSGEWNVVGGNDKNRMEETTVGKVYLHPEFDVVTFSKDLALLFLDTPLHYNRGANTICLPTHHDAWNPNKCVVVGWAKKNSSGLKSAVLRQVDLEIVAQGKCRHRDGLKNGLSDLEDPGYLCAHARKDDPYLGDVGSSLLCPLYNTDAFMQVGFISKSTPGKRDGKTTTFTDIFGSLDWVFRMEGIYAFVRGEDSAD